MVRGVISVSSQATYSIAQYTRRASVADSLGSPRHPSPTHSNGVSVSRVIFDIVHTKLWKYAYLFLYLLEVLNYPEL